MDRNLSRTIWICTLLILTMGLIALYSASFQNIRVSNKVFYDQLWCAFAGVVIMFFLGRVDYRKFYDVAYVFYILNIVLLILVIVMGRNALGARRWVVFGGFSFQPSELTKLSIILLLGRYFSKHQSTLSFQYLNRPRLLFRDLFIPLCLTIVPMLLIFKQPDLGTSLLIFGIFYIMWFVSGVNLRLILGFSAVCLACIPFAWNILKPYQKDRLLVFLNPNVDPLGEESTQIHDHQNAPLYQSV